MNRQTTILFGIASLFALAAWVIADGARTTVGEAEAAGPARVSAIHAPAGRHPAADGAWLRERHAEAARNGEELLPLEPF